MFDGHLTHISAPVIEKALKQNIIILYFPPHVTDMLQPLDVACFGLLKREWERRLPKRIWHQATANQVRICQWVMCNLEYRNEER